MPTEEIKPQKYEVLFDWTKQNPFVAAEQLTEEEIYQAGESFEERQESDKIIGSGEIADLAKRIFTLVLQYQAAFLKITGTNLASGETQIEIDEAHSQLHQLEDLLEKIERLEPIGFIVAGNASGFACYPHNIRRGWVLVETDDCDRIFDTSILETFSSLNRKFCKC